MADLNRYTCTGRLTRDSELRATQGKTPVLAFGLAVNDPGHDEQGNYEERGNFLDVTLFGAQAESLAPILKKGIRISVDGRLRYSSWEKDGQRRSKVEVVAQRVNILTPKGQAPAAAGPADTYDEDVAF